MTKIYTPREIDADQIPKSEDLIQSNLKIHEVLTSLSDKGQIIGASSYGSLATLNKTGHVSSDLDWLVLFDSLESLSDCEPLAKLTRWLKTKHLDFSNPILSLDSINQGNHIIGPILYSIKANTERVVIGKDPVELFDLKHEKLVEVISRLFHTFTRYFYENLVHYPLAKEDIEVLIGLLQSALNFFLDTYRSMQILQDKGGEKVSYQKYLEYYQGRLKDELLEDGLKVSNFIADYKMQIEKVYKEKTPEEMANYLNFLKESTGVIMSSARFARGNIEFFRSTECQTK